MLVNQRHLVLVGVAGWKAQPFPNLSLLDVGEWDMEKGGRAAPPCDLPTLVTSMDS